MEEAQRLLTVSVWKLYRCRLRRGGLRLHRSLQLSLLVRAARHRYLSARAAAETLPVPAGEIHEPGRDTRGEISKARGPDRATAERTDRPNPPRDRTGDIPNRPSGQEPGNPPMDWTGEILNRPNRPSGQEPGNTPMDWTGEIPNRPNPPRDRTGEFPNPPSGQEPRNPPMNWTGEIPNRPTGQEPGNPPMDWTGEHPNPPNPPSGQEWGNPSKNWTGEHPNPPTGAPRAEPDRGCPPEAPPAPRTAPDPPNRHRDPPGAPRAGQKRRSSGSAGPGPGPVPSKRARLEAEAPPLPPGRCSGPPAAAFGLLVRAVGAC